MGNSAKEQANESRENSPSVHGFTAPIPVSTELPLTGVEAVKNALTIPPIIFQAP
jgi:hypothetical protein